MLHQGIKHQVPQVENKLWSTFPEICVLRIPDEVIDNVKKEEEVEWVVEGEAEAGPGGAALVVVAPLRAEVVAVDVAGGEDTRGVVWGRGRGGGGSVPALKNCERGF